MKKRIFMLTVLALLLALPVTAFAGGPPDGRPVGPPGGLIWANDVAYQTVATPTDPLPDSAPDDSSPLVRISFDDPILVYVRLTESA